MIILIEQHTRVSKITLPDRCDAISVTRNTAHKFSLHNNNNENVRVDNVAKSFTIVSS